MSFPRAFLALFFLATPVRAAPPPARAARDVGWLEAGERRRVFLNRAPAGGPIRFAGRTQANGIAITAPVMVLARLTEPAVEFAATIGVDSDQRLGANSRGPTVRFVIHADGRRVFESQVLSRADSPRELRLPLPRARDIVLAVDDGGDGPVDDHALWGAPRARVEGGDWVALADLPWRPPPVNPVELAARPGRVSFVAFSFP